MKVAFDERAYSDLTEIQAYILDRMDAGTATSYVDRILSYCEVPTTFSRRGTPRDDLRAGVRSRSSVARGGSACGHSTTDASLAPRAVARLKGR